MENSTSAPSQLLQLNSAPSQHRPTSNGNASLYILIVLSFYGFFLCAVLVGYCRSKRKEQKRTNVFTKLVHDKEKQAWGALPKKHSLNSTGLSVLTLPFCSNHSGHVERLGVQGMFPSPLACAMCTEQSSVSSLCSTVDTRVTIEEEQDSSTEDADDSG
ncbi:hypothetical protein WMY93_028929 [Mugilogobius chulae]|uniref:Potassium voltage-gated channel subfamily E member 4 n=1 Tax=Mugilogobius chulae TaxID=88201 RepID=A0AAW0MQT2_9GOBI